MTKKESFVLPFTSGLALVFALVIVLLSPNLQGQNWTPEPSPFNSGFDAPLGGFGTGTAPGADVSGFSAMPGAGNQVKDHLIVTAVLDIPAGQQSGKLTIKAQVAEGFHTYSITQKKGGPLPSQIIITPSSLATVGAFTAQTPPKSVTVDYYPVPMEEHRGEIVWTAPVQLAPNVNPADVAFSGVIKYMVCSDIDENCLPPTEVKFTATVNAVPATGIPAAEAVTPADAVDSATGNSETGFIQNTSIQNTSLQNVPSTDPSLSGTENAQDTQNVYNTQGEQDTQNSETATADSVSAAAPIDGRTLVVYAFMAFLGGLILNVMPCVLPVISLKLLSFLDQAGESRARVFILNLWYVAGLMVVFLFLAALTTYASMGWGQLFTFIQFKIGMCAFIFAMALSLLGVWEIPIPGFIGGNGTINSIQQKEGVIGAFSKGIFTTIMAVPCTGPFLGPVLGMVMGQPFWFTSLIFSMIGLGMGFPYLVVGLYPELLSFLPKPGGWMNTVREFMGFLLLGTVVYFIAMITPALIVPTLTLLLCIWFFCWIVNKIPYEASLVRTCVTWLLALAFCGGISYGMFAWYLHETSFPWDKVFSPDRIVAAHNEGRVVMIDFTADWCPNCKYNLYTAIETKDVEDVIRQNNIYAVLADWSDQNATIQKYINQLNRQSIPLLVIFPAGDRAPIIMDSVITKSQLISKLQEALDPAVAGKTQPEAVQPTSAEQNSTRNGTDNASSDSIQPAGNAENTSDQVASRIRSELQNSYGSITDNTSSAAAEASEVAETDASQVFVPLPDNVNYDTSRPKPVDTTTGRNRSTSSSIGGGGSSFQDEKDFSVGVQFVPPRAQ